MAPLAFPGQPTPPPPPFIVPTHPTIATFTLPTHPTLAPFTFPTHPTIAPFTVAPPPQFPAAPAAPVLGPQTQQYYRQYGQQPPPQQFQQAVQQPQQQQQLVPAATLPPAQQQGVLQQRFETVVTAGQGRVVAPSQPIQQLAQQPNPTNVNAQIEENAQIVQPVPPSQSAAVSEGRVEKVSSSTPNRVSLWFKEQFDTTGQ
ncbi:hypothetical protein ANCCAN_12668 [Ancylostoma caninum]|uniref:Uncharacterized protein n=1 Tax=Ancylostoma caninum TaxID=29170 RepID=A0A368GEV4_ANCCA|nr:hypothetical protein ANCCAN_12668 [Ancylostoma caninum]